MRDTSEQSPGLVSRGEVWIRIALVLVFAGSLTLIGLWALWQGGRAAVGQTVGVSGRVEVTDCDTYVRRNVRHWNCSGVLVADGGEFRIRRVTIEPKFDERPTEPVRVRVSGPDATVAWIPSRVPYAGTSAGLAFLILASGACWAFLHDIGADEDGLSKRARRRLERQRRGPPRPPQMGNRARSRRRRRRRSS